MEIRLAGLVVVACLAFGLSSHSSAQTSYYIDDNSNTGDVYTPDFTGNDVNNGLTPSTPKLTLNNLLAATNLVAGDIVYIDAGTYTNNVVIADTVNGAAGNPILFQGSPSTQPAEGGTTFTGVGDLVLVRGSYLHFRDIRMVGGANGFVLDGASYNSFERVYGISNQSFSIVLNGASNTNTFHHCVFTSISLSAFRGFAPAKGNDVQSCIMRSEQLFSIAPATGVVSNMADCILLGEFAFASDTLIPDRGSRNIFGTRQFCGDVETLADLQNSNTNWYGNTVAAPRLVNENGFDFHLLSASGFVSNGVWVTNAAVGYSPGIDFGARE